MLKSMCHCQSVLSLHYCLLNPYATCVCESIKRFSCIASSFFPAYRPAATKLGFPKLSRTIRRRTVLRGSVPVPKAHTCQAVLIQVHEQTWVIPSSIYVRDSKILEKFEHNEQTFLRITRHIAPWFPWRSLFIAGVVERIT